MYAIGAILAGFIALTLVVSLYFEERTEPDFNWKEFLWYNGMLVLLASLLSWVSIVALILFLSILQKIKKSKLNSKETND